MHQEPNLRTPSGTKIFAHFSCSYTDCFSAPWPLTRLRRQPWIGMQHIDIRLNSQPVATGAYFGLKSWRQDGTVRVSSFLRGSLVWRGRWSTNMGYCAGMLTHLDPRLGMVREYDTIEIMSKNYILILLKNTGATTKWVAPTPPPTKWMKTRYIHQ